MKPSKTRFGPPQECDHCGNVAPLAIVASHTQTYRVWVHSVDGVEINDKGTRFRTAFELLECGVCLEVTLRRHRSSSPPVADRPEGSEQLYPAETVMPLGLPGHIRDALAAALRVRRIDPNAYAVLVRRILEMTCQDRGAAGNHLGARLEDLSAKGEIPEKLVAVARSLRQLGNVGAHASIGELTKEEVPLLDDLCRAILEYVYSAPHLVAQAEFRLRRINAPPEGEKP